MKLVINANFGGFSLSAEAINWLQVKGLSMQQIRKLELHENRANKLLVECVETLGLKANGFCATLKVVEYEYGPYYIEEYDGAETVVTTSEFYIPKYELDPYEDMSEEELKEYYDTWQTDHLV